MRNDNVFSNTMRDVLAGVGCTGADTSAVTMYLAEMFLV